MRLTDLSTLLTLGAIWGASFMLMRTAAPEFGPFALVEVRAVLASLFLLPFVVLSKQMTDMLAHWRGLLMVGALNTAIPFCLFSYSSIHIEAGLNSILNATAPMFGVVVAFLYLRERISKFGLLGLCLGFSGVSVISEQAIGSADLSILPVFASLGATLCYGMSASYIKKHLHDVKPFAIAAGSQIFTALLILPFAIVYWPEQKISLSAWQDAMLLAIFCTGLAYVLYFKLITNVGASKALTVAYLVPLFGIAWGILLLDETLSLQSMIGGILVILGVMLTTGLFERLKTGKSN